MSKNPAGAGDGPGDDAAKTGRVVMPTVLNFAFCDYILQCGKSRKLSLINLYDKVFCAVFPTEHHTTLFISVVGGHGYYPVKYRQVTLETGESRVVGESYFVVADPLEPIPWEGQVVLAFPRPGWYAVELHARGELLISRRIQAVQQAVAPPA